MQIVKCLNCGYEFELTRWKHDDLGEHAVCPKCESSFDIVSELSQKIEERLLSFEYGGNDNIEKAKQLCTILEEHNIDYVAYNLKQNYWNPSFLIRKGKKSWNDIIRLVNTIKAPCYKYKKETFYIAKQLEQAKGNIQIIHCC